MAFSFFGGIHPKENKWLSCDREIEEFPEPDVLVIPMSQHIGAPCKPLVKKGDPVTVGMKLGECQGLGVPVHSPVSGKVKAVEMRAHTSGTSVMSVVIENDHKKTLCPEVKPRTQAQVDALSPQELMDIIREGGVVGMGGATFPTHVKLSSGIGKVDTIIVNVSECEPFITADDRLCREKPEDVIAGLRVVMKVLGLEKAHIAVEDNKPEAIRSLKQELGSDTGITVDVLPARYPQGAEKQLIYAVTGREVPSGGLPAAVGCAVFNAATCKAIFDAVYQGLPLVKRVVTVSGDIVLEPKNLLVCVGTPFLALMDCVGIRENPYKVLSGGPMMGVTQYDLMVPVIKGVNAVTLLGRRNRFTAEEPRCLRCGKCIEACPMKLMPVMMYKTLQSGNADEIRATNLMDCIECGCCAYVCPAGVPLVLGFRAGKQRLRDAAAKAKV